MQVATRRAVTERSHFRSPGNSLVLGTPTQLMEGLSENIETFAKLLVSNA